MIGGLPRCSARARGAAERREERSSRLTPESESAPRRTTSPDSYASTTAWTRSRRPSLASRLLTWVLTVCSVTNSSAAISALDSPRASWRSVSRLPRAQPASRAATRSPGRMPTVRRPRPGGDQIGDQPAGHRRREQRLTGRHHPDRVDQVLPAHGLEQEAAGPGPQRVVDVLVEVVRGQHQHPGRRSGRRWRRWRRCRPCRASGRPSAPRPGASATAAVDRLRAVAGLADHGDVRLGVEDDREARPHQGLVVDDEHPQRAGRAQPPAASVPARSGNGARSPGTRPRPSPAPVSSVPPNACTRSRMPTRPRPPATAGAGRAATVVAHLDAQRRVAPVQTRPTPVAPERA